MDNKWILICEDDEGIAEIVQIVLEGKGYKVVCLHDSRTVYTKIAEVKPDLVLLDLWMPGLSGEEIVRHLKANEITRPIPIIIISANRDTEKIAKQAGADAFLGKPFDLVVLENIVEGFLSNRLV
jgi:DNA-binding response OmpR family regulator